MRRSTRQMGLAVGAVLATAGMSHAAITYYIQGDNWAADRRAAAVAAMDAAVGRYNAYGGPNGFNKVINVYYNSGVATADANYNGTLRFGGTWPNERVSLHEIAHTLGGGTTWQWGANLSGGIWTGPRGVALIKQFDGNQANLNSDGTHFWGYGLNYDSEASAINNQRHVAIMYAVRGDMGIGPTAHPSTATNVTLTATDALGESGFNYHTKWSDGYFAHAGAAYSTGNFAIRTPASANSFNFAGDSLTLNNAADPNNGGLYYKGTGTSGVITINNLRLDGGTIHHVNGAADLFQLDGTIDVVSPSRIRAAQGSINVLSDLSGSATLTITQTPIADVNNGFVRLRSNANTFTGNIDVQGRFELSDGANHRFAIGANGVNNAITGASAQWTALNGNFQIDLAAAGKQLGDTWSLVTAANRSYGRNFAVIGFNKTGADWVNGDYTFNQNTGLLAFAPATREWIVNGSGNWNTFNVWSPNGAPTAIHPVLLGNAITQDATITIQHGGGVAASTTVNTSHAYTVALNGPTAFHAGNLTIQSGTLALAAGGETTLRAKSLSITGGNLDLADNAAILDYAGASPLADVRAMIASGKIVGLGTDVSSGAKRVGYGEASALLGAEGGTFGNETVAGDAILLFTTLAGDTNLDEVVDFDDLLALAQNYGTTSDADWTRGDFDYNGTVDFSDLLALAQQYGNGTGLTADFAADWALAQSLVPEPISLSMLTAGGLLIARRRR